MLMDKSLELHVNKKSRNSYLTGNHRYSPIGKLLISESYQIREITEKINQIKKKNNDVQFFYKSSDLNALALIERINHFLIKKYLLEADNLAFSSTLNKLNNSYGNNKIDRILQEYLSNFSAKEKLNLAYVVDGIPIRELLLEEIILLKICNNNRAAAPYKDLFDDTPLIENSIYTPAFYTIMDHFDQTPKFGPHRKNLIKLLMEPAQKHPNSLLSQIEYIKDQWPILTDSFLLMLLQGLDMIREENKIYFSGPGPSSIPLYTKHNEDRDDTPNFSRDSNWMPGVILLAKNALVWLDQLSRDYKQEIRSLNQIPDEELDIIASRGINCLWLIGIWNRSNASKEIKKRCGNEDAVSSAYSLFSYDISFEIGGWDSLTNLKTRCKERGIRLASDMVPNHTGIDSEWTRSRPNWFIQSDRPPFPSYTYNSENLSEDPNIGIYLEDHYYDKSDAAVTFKRVDFHTGEERYIYHGNDGTTMPWNDTAQLDFLQHEVREAVIDQILHVARNFPVIRFDAAMTLAKKHIQRLWYPEPGKGGDIASRSNFAMSQEDFENAVGGEFWKEVVARVVSEAPDTLLLAEAFWMMEGYFVRNLGMHRVYNSAFMNMIQNEENDKYRETIKTTLNYDRKILKRFVNFMNNPDEETAAIQFGTGDKYFGVMTLMLTMPGLPMIGHGQIEGYKEKYGMEFKKPLRDEYPDPELVGRHEREIFPILKKRYLFVSVKNFRLYDLIGDHGCINENVFAYSNQADNENVLVFYNNSYERAAGFIKNSAQYVENSENQSHYLSNSLGESLNLTNDEEYYCLFKEIKNDTWFIRNNRGIYEHGLYVELNGYQSQVFTEIHQLKNSESNHIREIAIKLNNSGTENLDREYREMIFKPLYNKLNCLINKEIIAQINAEDFDLNAFTEALKDKIESTVETVKEFSKGTGEVCAITDKIIKNLVQPQKILTLLEKEKDFSKAFLSNYTLEKKLTLYLISIFHQFGSIVSEKEGWRINKDLFNSWMLREYLRDIFTDINNNENFINEIIPTLRFFTESYNTEKPLFSKDISIETFQELQKMEGFSPLLGINKFGENIWFSKEKFESFLWWAQYRYLIEHKKPDVKRLQVTIKTWEKAAVKSEYDFDRFLALIK